MCQFVALHVIRFAMPRYSSTPVTVPLLTALNFLLCYDFYLPVITADITRHACVHVGNVYVYVYVFTAV